MHILNWNNTVSKRVEIGFQEVRILGVLMLYSLLYLSPTKRKNLFLFVQKSRLPPIQEAPVSISQIRIKGMSYHAWPQISLFVCFVFVF